MGRRLCTKPSWPSGHHLKRSNGSSHLSVREGLLTISTEAHQVLMDEVHEGHGYINIGVLLVRS